MTSSWAVETSRSTAVLGPVEVSKFAALPGQLQSCGSACWHGRDCRAAPS
jgi:hypothetical protein